MRKATVLGGFLSFSVLLGNVHWLHFKSRLQPYTILQPSSYRHAVLQDTDRRRVDYFFPSLGSPITNVNICSFPGDATADPSWYLRSIGGRRVRRVARVTIMGRRMRMIEGQFAGLVGRWTVDQVTFANHGRIWRLTASYDDKFRSERGLMLRMLATFRLR